MCQWLYVVVRAEAAQYRAIPLSSVLVPILPSVFVLPICVRLCGTFLDPFEADKCVVFVW